MNKYVRARRPAVRVAPEPIIRVERATYIPTGMHGVQEEQLLNEGWRTATIIPTGMHAAQFLDKRRILDDIVEGLIARGVDPVRARILTNRASMRRHGSFSSGMGDVVADGTTWITYGNEIIERSKTGNVGEEAQRAASNISNFLANRGSELDAVSSATVDAMGEMADKLARIARGQIKYDSVTGAFLDELGNAIRGEVIVGARAVYDAPKKFVRYVGEEVVKPALDVIPWYVWTGVAVAGGAVVGKMLKLW